MKKNIKNFLKKCIKYVSIVFYILPINKKKIVACNFFGNGYGDNPKYLVEEILKIDSSYKIIWITHKKGEFPEYIKPVKYNSLASFYHMITAKLWLDTIRNNPRPLFKRKSQVYIQMWHGGIMMKGQEKDVEELLSKEYVNAAKYDGKISDYMLSNCRLRTELIKKSFWFTGEILEFGIPRDDILFNPDMREISKLKEKYDIVGKKIVLYAPSFRNNPNFYDDLDINVSKLMECIHEKFGDEFVLCMKCHPNDSGKIDFERKYLGVIDLSKESDSQLILSASDVVISDYSSMLLDFTLTKKPAFIYAPDYDYYINKERNLYIDLKNVAMPFADNFDSLVENIRYFNVDKYHKNLDAFFEFYGIFEDGSSSNKIAKYLIENKII